MDGVALRVAVVLDKCHTAPMLDRDSMSSMAIERHHLQNTVDTEPAIVHSECTLEEQNIP